MADDTIWPNGQLVIVENNEDPTAGIGPTDGTSMAPQVVAGTPGPRGLPGIKGDKGDPGDPHIIQNNGSDLPHEERMNFLPPLVATDDPENGSTDISIDGSALGVTIGNPVIGGTPTDFLYVDGSGNLAQSGRLQTDGTKLTITGNVVPSALLTYDLGDTLHPWNNGYIGNVITTNITNPFTATAVNATGALNLGTASSTTDVNLGRSSQKVTIVADHLLAPNGSTSAPAYSFTNSTDMGLWRVGSRDVRLQAHNGGSYTEWDDNSGITTHLSGFSPSDQWTVVDHTGSPLLTLPENTGGVLAATAGFTAGDGSTGSPSYSFTTDTDTGIYLGGTNNMRLVAGGNEMLFVTPSTVYVNGSLTVLGGGAGLDTLGAGALNIGQTNATSVHIAQSGVVTSVEGTLQIQGAAGIIDFSGGGTNFDSLGSYALTIARAQATSLVLGNNTGSFDVTLKGHLGSMIFNGNTLYPTVADGLDLGTGGNNINALHTKYVLVKSGGYIDTETATTLTVGGATANRVLVGSAGFNSGTMAWLELAATQTTLSSPGYATGSFLKVQDANILAYQNNVLKMQIDSSQVAVNVPIKIVDTQYLDAQTSKLTIGGANASRIELGTNAAASVIAFGNNSGATIYLEAPVIVDNNNNLLMNGGRIDTLTASALSIGTSTATQINIGRNGIGQVNVWSDRVLQQSPDGGSFTQLENGRYRFGVSTSLFDMNSAQTAITNPLQLTTTTTPSTPSAGATKFYSVAAKDTDALAFVNSMGIQVVMGRDLFFLAKNNSGGTLTKGTPVFISGATGANVLVQKAQADSGMTKLPCQGIVAADAANNATVAVQTRGILALDTSAFSAGDVLYVSAITAGVLTNTAPSHPSVEQFVATVETSGVGNGTINVSVVPLNLHRIDGTNQATFAIGDATGTTKSLLVKNASGTGTLSWNPTTNRTLTLPDATDTLVGQSRTISAGTGLSGGGDLSANRTISMPNTGPGATTTGGGSSFVNSITTDAQGRISSIATGTPTASISIGTSVGSGTNKSVLFLDSGPSLAQDNSYFQYDSSTHILGVNAVKAVSAAVAPTISFYTPGMGTVTGASIAGNAFAGVITFTTGTVSGFNFSNGADFTVTTGITAPNGWAVTLIPANSNTANAFNQFNIQSSPYIDSTTTTWSLQHVSSNPYSGATQYKFNYIAVAY